MPLFYLLRSPEAEIRGLFQVQNQERNIFKVKHCLERKTKKQNKKRVDITEQLEETTEEKHNIGFSKLIRKAQAIKGKKISWVH